MYAVAFDIGTTTCAGMLLDVKKKKQLAVFAMTNPQTVFGDDVISRIDFAKKEKTGLQRLNKKALLCINKVITTLSKQANIPTEEISKAAFVGNTAMMQFALGISTDKLAVAPYLCDLPKREPVIKKAESIGIKIKRKGEVIFLPAIGGFIGSDLVADIIAVGLHKTSKPTLLVDLGTNGEIALKYHDRLVVVSTAAGPAFEGGHIKFGMRAQKGAIEQINLKGKKVNFKVIGGSEPKGICGSGLISLLAHMLDKQIMDETGRIQKPFKVYKSISISQKDIRELQLAKAAIKAGISVLLKRQRLKIGDLSKIYLTGAFGNFLDKTLAMKIGLVPKAALNKVKAINDAALEGAKLTLCTKDGIETVQKIAKSAIHIRLFAKQDFRTEFINSMNFADNKNLRS